VVERKRSEQALIQVIQEAFINGVSTRKVERLAKALGIEDMSASQVSEITRGLDEQVEEFRSRALEVLKAERQQESHTVRIYAGTACEGCLLRENCTTASQRTLNVDSREPLCEQMREKLRTDRGREIYMKRQGIVEAGHGDDQHNKGWQQHLLRGKAKAALEFMLVRIGSNLSKIATHKPMELLALT